MRKKPGKQSRAMELRDKIDALAIIDALQEHVLGLRKMTASQVSAALALLKNIGGENNVASYEDSLKDLE